MTTLMPDLSNQTLAGSGKESVNFVSSKERQHAGDQSVEECAKQNFQQFLCLRTHFLWSSDETAQATGQKSLFFSQISTASVREHAGRGAVFGEEFLSYARSCWNFISGRTEGDFARLTKCKKNQN